jgi:Ca-activated chloride channel family protein
MTARRFRSIVWAGVVAGAMVGLSCAKMSNAPSSQATAPPIAPTAPTANSAPATQPTRTIALNLDQALPVDLPLAKQDLTPVWFKTSDGKPGWVVRIPGSRPIATPAYAKGMLFIGGGYGSHEFYALDAKDGHRIWTHLCADDGPTAAVVDEDDGDIIFNTESCEMEIVDLSTGKLKWKEYLGDPLMSQPAIAKGKIFMAYPGGHPHGLVKAAANGSIPDEPAAPEKVGPAKAWGHRLLCADVKTGKHLWEQDITADAVSAPVVDADRVYLTCFDGTSFCIDAQNGAIIWQKKNAGTSAPLIVQGNVVITQKQHASGKISEGMKRIASTDGVEKDKVMLAAGEAKYLKPGAVGNSAYSKSQEKQLETSVGFAPQSITWESPAAQSHLNIGSVAVGWSYQGARAAYSNGQLLNAQGNTLNCIGFATGETAWRAEATGKDVSPDVQMFAPPALGEKNLYVCSASGHVASLQQSDGQVRFLYALKQPMAFQPALANGNIYLATTDGRVICIQTGDQDADGWYAWGGNGQHNKSR